MRQAVFYVLIMVRLIVGGTFFIQEIDYVIAKVVDSFVRKHCVFDVLRYIAFGNAV